MCSAQNNIAEQYDSLVSLRPDQSREQQRLGIDLKTSKDNKHYVVYVIYTEEEKQ